MKHIIFCLLAWQYLLLGQSVVAAETAQEAAKALMERYTAVEAQLGRAVHYIKQEGTAPETTVQQAWYNEFGGLLKVATERKDAAGRELKEYFPYEPDENPAAMRMFHLVRREKLLPDGATRVEEERIYLRRSKAAGLQTLRKLTKSAEFKAGQPLDMEHVRNVVSKPAPRSPDSDPAEAAERDREFMEEPSNIARSLRAAGTKHEPPVPAKEIAPADKGPAWAANAVSPDGLWELRLLPPDETKEFEGGFVVALRKNPGTVVALSEEAGGTFAEASRIVWALDSKRFAFHYQPGLRYQTLQLFQLDGAKWRELESPAGDEAITAPIERSMAAQRKKLKLSPNQQGRPISGGCEVRRWLDSSTALLLVEDQETFMIGDELEQVGDVCLITLKFDAKGNWRIARSRLLSAGKRADLNRDEQEELARMEKDPVKGD